MSVLRIISTLLPPPNYLYLPSVGVDISETSLKYIQLQPDAYRGKAYTVKHHGSIAIEPGTLERGEILNVNKLADALREVRKRTKSPYVRLSLPEERAYLFETQVKKGVSFTEVRGQLEFRLEENVPLAPRDAYFDYELYPLQDSAQRLGVSVTVYARKTINGYYEACRMAGVTPLSFEVEAQAIARALVPDEQAVRTYLIIDCGKTRTGIGVVHKGILMYTSTIEMGGNELTSALRRQLGDIDDAEVTTLKNTRGLVRGKGQDGVYDALIATVSAITDEIARRIEYWNTRGIADEDRYIEKAFICGGGANLNGFPEYLSKVLNIQTVRADVWSNVFADKDVVPPIDQQHAYGFATAIGLGLSSYR